MNLPEFVGDARIEDTSHASLNVEFMVLATQNNIVFDGKDLSHLAITFEKNVVKPNLAISNFMNGVGISSLKYINPGWMSLALVEKHLLKLALPFIKKSTIKKG